MRYECEIGEILEGGEIEKDLSLSGEGMIYKNSKAFYEKTGVCYVSELDDEKYCYNDFLELAHGNEKIAELIFKSVDWQSPTTFLERLLEEGEVHICEGCKNMYMSYEVEYCPNCNQRKENDIIHTEEEVKYVYIVDDTEYEVILYKNPLKESGFKWESLMFAGEDGELFAKVVNRSTKEWSSLTIDGLVKVIDECEDRELPINKVRDLAKNSQIDDDKYFVDNNNWFAIHYFNKDNFMIDDYVFECTPKSYGELATQLIESHLSYFENN